MTWICVEDAGWAARKSGHSQAGALFLLGDLSVLEGHEVYVNVVDWLTSKILRVVRSSYACETHAAMMANDQLEYLQCLQHQLWYNWNAADYRAQGPNNPSAMVSDCKSLYSKLTSETNAVSSHADRSATIDIQILRQSLAVTRNTIWWTNNEHMIADALTKASDNNARLDLLLRLMTYLRFRITYCSVSGRREAQYKSTESWYEDAPEEPEEYQLNEMESTDGEAEN